MAECRHPWGLVPSLSPAAVGGFRAHSHILLRGPGPEKGVCDFWGKPELGPRSPQNQREAAGWKRSVRGLGLVVGSIFAHSGVVPNPIKIIINYNVTQSHKMYNTRSEP